MATAAVRTFWSALVSVFLKCIAALGFATPARTAPVRTTAAQAPASARTTAATAFVIPVPAPRRDRSLPPTMKQRIRAEAHGASPSARSMLVTGETEQSAEQGLKQGQALFPAQSAAQTPARIREQHTAPTRPAILCG